MAGGELVVTPIQINCVFPRGCLYGTTGGQILLRGKAGEHFSV